MKNTYTTSNQTQDDPIHLDRIINEISRVKSLNMPTELKVGSAAIEAIKRSPHLIKKDVASVNEIWGLPVVVSDMLPPYGYAILDKHGRVLSMGYLQ